VAPRRRPASGKCSRRVFPVRPCDFLSSSPGRYPGAQGSPCPEKGWCGTAVRPRTPPRIHCIDVSVIGNANDYESFLVLFRPFMRRRISKLQWYFAHSLHSLFNFSLSILSIQQGPCRVLQTEASLPQHQPVYHEFPLDTFLGPILVLAPRRYCNPCWG